MPSEINKAANARMIIVGNSFMRKGTWGLIALIVTLTSCVHAQKQKWGGTGVVGGPMGLQSSTAPTLQILTNSLPNAVIGVAYSQTIATQFGVAPVTCTLDSGSLPPGITQSGTGNCTLAGTPVNNAGPYSFVIKATDSSGTPQVAKQPLSIQLVCTPLQYAGPTVIPVADSGSAFTFTLQTSGGIAPISCSAATGLPTGESVNSSCGLSGTPSVPGTFSNIQLTISDSCPTSTQTVPLTLSQQVNATLAITTPPSLQGGSAGVLYTTQIAVAGGTPGYTYSLTSGTLPAGIALNASTGSILGTSNAPGSYQFRITVTDSIANTAFLDFTLIIACPPISISTLTLPNATQTQPYSFQELLNATGFGAVTWTGSLFPNGLGISPSGRISGTSTEFGNFAPQMVATDSCPTPQTATVAPTLMVAQQAGPLTWQTPTQLPDAIEGQAVNDQLVVSGGAPPYTFSKTAGSIPAGTSLSSGSSAALTGTVTTSGSSSFTEQVTDSLFPTATTISQTFAINVNCPAFSVPQQTLPPATQGTLYKFQMQSSGGFGSVTWGASGLPSGLPISSSGLVSGTPSVSGPFTPTLTATDACSPTPQAISVTLPLQVNTNLAITTAALGSCTVNQACSDPLNATGGTPPYTWSITAGTLQTGLSLTGANIAGTPSASGTVTLTIKVTDSIPNNVSTSLPLTVNPVVVAGGADNRYCPATEVSTMAQDGPAMPIQKCVNTALANTPSNGSTVTVTAGSLSSLQNSINAATCGQTVIIPALNGAAQDVISGNITISNKCTSAAWLTIRTSQITSLPAEGSRVSPAFIGIPSLHIACPVGSNGPNGECGRPPYSQPATPGTYMPKLLGVGSNAPTVSFKGASHVRIIGLEITSPAGQANTKPQVITDGGVAADHIVLDRVIVHGGNSPNFQNKTSVQAAVRFAATQYWGLVDSYIADTGCVANVVCTDSQAVFGGGQSLLPSGPGKIVDNFIETSGEEVFNGGGGAGPNTLSATDTEIRRNHFFKPMFWKSNDPSYFGTNFEIKNHLEFKNANRALIEANLFEQNWGFQSDQHGEAVHFNAFNQNLSYTGSATSDGTGKLTFVSGTQFKSDIVAPTCSIANHCLVKYNGVLYRALTWISGTQITVNTLATGAGTVPPITGSASFTAAEPGENPSATVSNVTMRYNRVSHAGNGIEITDPFSDNGDVAAQSGGYSLHDNVLDDIDGGRWELGGSQACCNWGYGFEVFENYPAPLNEHDISIWHNTALGTASTSGSTSQGSAFGAGNSVAGLLKNVRIYDNLGSGGWANLGAFGTSAQISWNNWTPVAQKCWDNNFLATSTTATSGTGSFTKINLPYPAPVDNGFCPYGTPKGNTVVTSFATFQFTLLNGANGGNYLLLNTSPYKGLASDGTDPGANINLVNTNLAGVQ